MGKKPKVPMTIDALGNAISVAELEERREMEQARAAAKARREAKAKGSIGESVTDDVNGDGGTADANDTANTSASGVIKSLEDQLKSLVLKTSKGEKLTGKEKRMFAKAEKEGRLPSLEEDDGEDDSKKKSRKHPALALPESWARALEAVTVHARVGLGDDEGSNQSDAVVDVSGLDVSIRGVRLLEDASLTILRGAKVCLLGANGSGKSTLVRLIASGKIKTKVHDVACVSQELEASERSALETLQECDHVSAELMNEEEKLLKAMDDDGSSSNKLTDEELVKAAQRLGEISELLNQRGAYDASSNARRILTGLGFDDRKMNTPLSTLSGGWRMRASLAIALFISPGLLLLDEPTNHLDLPATIWLASYLNSDRCKKTSVLMVTHSADFVSEVGTYTSHKILLAFSCIFATSVSSFSTNHVMDSSSSRYEQRTQYVPIHPPDCCPYKRLTYISKILATHLIHLDHFKHSLTLQKHCDVWRFLAAAPERFRLEKKVYDEQQKTLKTLKQKGSSNDAAVRKVLKDSGGKKSKNNDDFDNDNQGLLTKPREYDVSFTFPGADDDRPTIAVLDAGYTINDPEEPDNKPPLVEFKDLRFSVHSKSRIVLVGPNGCGKSTLLKLLTGETTPQAGEIHIHRDLKLGVHDQHHDLLFQGAGGEDGGAPSLSAAKLLETKFSIATQESRKLLGRAGLESNAHLTPVTKLSGGQKSRVAFAALCASPQTVLCLDEPTNHLDLESVEALMVGLNEFKGGVVVSTHDARVVEGLEESEVWVVGSTGRQSNGSTGIEVLPRGGFQKYRAQVALDVETKVEKAKELDVARRSKHKKL